MASVNDPVQIAFNDAIASFRRELGNEDMYREILETRSIDDVYNLTDELQMKLTKKRQFNHLSKIAPFLKNLAEYAQVIEVFIQVKPDVMALIWGPIKLILQWASTVQQSFRAIIDISADIGLLLPEFRRIAAIFGESPQIRNVLVLFFEDMLNFYVVALKFFSMDGLKRFFEAFWPRRREKIMLIMEQIKQHTDRMRNGMHFEHIQAEFQARRDALKHFELAEKNFQQQEYCRIKTSVTPITYKGTLDQLQARFCDGTDAWLMKDDLFKAWLDNDDSSTRFLWLQGIPAAGKSLLSSAVVAKAQAQGRVAFAFLSHSMADKLTALSIVHSLIFQLADDYEDIQEVLCRSHKGTLKGGLSSSMALLGDLVRCCGPLRLIVDGIDEISDFEQTRVIMQLIKLEETCEELRILTSCRPTGEIESKLKCKKTIRIDQKNTGAIRMYIDSMITEWFQEAEFEPDVQKEIRGLLSPLPDKAEGMFLYARLVIDNLRPLGIGMVREELRVLPEDLDDAYARVIARIENTKPKQVKDTAFTILGWVGCAPAPLTIFEIESALHLSKAGDSDLSRSHGRTNIVGICGPVVEIVDEYVYFVHFTFKEYLFTSDICKSVSKNEAILTLALCCVNQFVQKDHDYNSSAEQLAGLIARGIYVFQGFASRWWLWLVEGYISSRLTEEVSPELIELLITFMHERCNQNFEEEIHPEPPSSFRALEYSQPALHGWLCRAHDFQQTIQKFGSQADKDAEWTTNDPTTVSLVSLRVCRKLNSMLCQTSEHHNNLQREQIIRKYGKRSFKCELPDCDYNRHGFESRELLEEHSGSHNCPLACGVQDCEYELGGFVSRKMRDDHIKNCHKVREDRATPELNLEQTDDVRLLSDLVKTNNFMVLKQLDLKAIKIEWWEKLNLIITAMRSSSPAIFSLLYTNWRPYFRGEALYPGKHLLAGVRESSSSHYLQLEDKIFQGASLINFQYLVSHMHITRYDHLCNSAFLRQILDSDNEDVWDVWILKSAELASVMGSEFLRSQNSWRDWECRNLVRGMAKQERRTEALMRWCDAIGGFKYNLRKFQSHLLRSFVSGDFPAYLVERFLRNGYSPDYKSSETAYTLSRIAAQRTSREAAETMRLLLSYGADPDLEDGFRPIREEKGAKGVHKWLGITFDQLVEDALQNPQARKAHEDRQTERAKNSEALEKAKEQKKARAQKRKERLERRRGVYTQRT